MNMGEGINACSSASTIDFWNKLGKLMDYSKKNKSMAFIPSPLPPPQ
jgi:hypothetical protein